MWVSYATENVSIDNITFKWIVSLFTGPLQRPKFEIGYYFSGVIYDRNSLARTSITNISLVSPFSEKISSLSKSFKKYTVSNYGCSNYCCVNYYNFE